MLATIDRLLLSLIADIASVYLETNTFKRGVRSFMAGVEAQAAAQLHPRTCSTLSSHSTAHETAFSFLRQHPTSVMLQRPAMRLEWSSPSEKPDRRAASQSANGD